MVLVVDDQFNVGILFSFEEEQGLLTGIGKNRHLVRDDQFKVNYITNGPVGRIH